MKRVEVIWTDITYREGGWNHSTEVDNFIKNNNNNTIHQLGYVYRETPEFLVIVDSYILDENDFGTIHKIPKGCIVSITTI